MKLAYARITIAHVFSCINTCQVSREMFEHSALCSNSFLGDPANVNACKNIFDFYTLTVGDMGLRKLQQQIRKFSFFYFIFAHSENVIITI